MERLNLNLPEGARARLQRLAKKHKVREAEYARELILRAIEQEEQAAFLAAVVASRTPELRRRERQIAEAMEGLRGVSR